MAYTIKRTDGTTLAVVADGSANITTDLTLIGKNYLNYGTALNENFIRLLENFANTSAPSKAIRGQIWYDSANGDVKVYNGTSWAYTTTNANAINASGTINAGNLNTTGALNVTGNSNVSNLDASGVITATGNIDGGNLNSSGSLIVTGNANVGNLGTTGLIIATGNVSGGNIRATGTGTVTASRLISNVATGTAPFTVSSTTQVANLNAATSGTAVTVTAAAQPNITSVGTLTALSVTGNTSSGNLLTAGTVTASRLISNIATGTAPFTVTSTTQVANLNAQFSGSALTATTAGTVTTAAQPNITSVGTLTSLTVGGNILPSANITHNLGSNTLRWATVWGVSSSALYADLAEKYHADDVYSPGTVMCLGGEHEVTKSTKDLDDKVFGVISTSPAYLMNDNNEHPLWLPIVLTGRANVMVTGTVSKGDWLVSAGDGTARAAGPGEVQFNLVIGRSLVNKTINTPALVEAYISTK